MKFLLLTKKKKKGRIEIFGHHLPPEPPKSVNEGGPQENMKT